MSRVRFGDYGLFDCWPVSVLVKAYRRRRSRRTRGRRRQWATESPPR